MPTWGHPSLYSGIGELLAEQLHAASSWLSGRGVMVLVQTSQNHRITE